MRSILDTILMLLDIVRYVLCIDDDNDYSTRALDRLKTKLNSRRVLFKTLVKLEVIKNTKFNKLITTRRRPPK